MSDRAIHIRPSGDAYDVIVEPAAEWAALDRVGLASHRAASRAAWALKVVHGWPIRDEATAPSSKMGVAGFRGKS